MQPKGLLVTTEWPKPNQDRNWRFPAHPFQKAFPVLGIEDGLRHRKVRAGFHFFIEAAQFFIQVFGEWIYRYSDRKISSAAKILPRPVGSLIQARHHFHEADGILFVYTGSFRIAPQRWRIAGDGEHVAHPADGPCAQKHRSEERR